MEQLKPSSAPLQEVLYQNKDRLLTPMTVSRLLDRCCKRDRTLLRDNLVQEEGHLRVNTTAGVHSTSDAVLKALQKRNKARAAKKKKAKSRAQTAEYKKHKAGKRRLIDLAPARAVKRSQLADTRSSRRSKRRARACANELLGNIVRTVVERHDSQNGNHV